MKVKQQPEDFRVEELTDVVAGDRGPFALYRLEKRGWTTPDAVEVIRRRWKLDARRLSYAGLKDKHARTVQYLTVFRGPERRLLEHDLSVQYVGQVGEPYESRHLRANRFRITLRDLDAAALPAHLQALDEVRRDGLPNYFDDQRFGSVRGHGEFVGRHLVFGRFEEALRIALTASYEFDRADQKREKRQLRAHWGDWAACRKIVLPGPTRNVFEHLLNKPGDFRGAVARLRPELRGLYLSVYQSYLWNRMLARWLEQHCKPDQLLRVRLQAGAAPFPRNLDAVSRDVLAGFSLPLPSARLHLEPADPILALVNSVLAEEWLELRRLQVKGVRSLFFSKGERAAHVTPAQLEHETGEDELNRGRRKLVLSFELPRGAYGTMLVKRITAV